jgi:hypothetical protein
MPNDGAAILQELIKDAEMLPEEYIRDINKDAYNYLWSRG